MFSEQHTQTCTAKIRPLKHHKTCIQSFTCTVSPTFSRRLPKRNMHQFDGFSDTNKIFIHAAASVMPDSGCHRLTRTVEMSTSALTQVNKCSYLTSPLEMSTSDLTQVKNYLTLSACRDMSSSAQRCRRVPLPH